MPRSRSSSTNGGVIGKKNPTSFGKDTIQSKTSTGCLSATQPGTRILRGQPHPPEAWNLFFRWRQPVRRIFYWSHASAVREGNSGRH